MLKWIDYFKYATRGNDSITLMILLIDNYDSFTYNIVHYLEELGADVEVHRNDAITIEQCLSSGAQAIVLSPGPSTPNEAGICLDLIGANKDTKIPLLGVCLGHQAIGQAFGGTIIRAPQLMHGKVSHVHHDGTGVFKGIPNPYEATRYHSLIVEKKTLPECLTVNAWTEDGVIMGLQHKTLPFYGVQFHPESIATHYGHELLANFMDLAGLTPQRLNRPAA